MSISVRFAPQPDGVLSADISTDRPEMHTPDAPIADYCGFLRPERDAKAVSLGNECVRDVADGFIADFEKNEAYASRTGEGVDCMVHVSTFIRLNGNLYVTYYANTSTAAEDPDHQEARFAICPENDPEDMTIVTVQKVGDLLDGKKITKVYDTVLMNKDENELYILWTASVEQTYYRLYRVFDLRTGTMGPVYPNRFKVGDTVNDFSMTGIVSALSAEGHAHKTMFSDIGIMQKLSVRRENGIDYYYTGAYSGNWNCIIKSRDLAEWEYVATPDFINLSLWENAVYVLGDRVYYFVRQQECEQGFLTYYDLNTKKWATPFLVKDTGSRSDFVYYRDKLYLVHAPINREGFGILCVDTEDIAKSRPMLVADLKSSLFYPFARVYGDEMYLSYTIDRKHIRLTHFDFAKYVRSFEA